MDITPPQPPLVPLVRSLPAGHRYEPHSHEHAQLVYAGRGTMSVITRDGRWVVPPEQAVWVPARVAHEIHCLGPLEMRSLYIHPVPAEALPRHCVVFWVTPLLRELVLAAAEFPECYSPEGPEARLAAVILDQLHSMKEAPLHLPLGRDPRLCVVTDILLVHPADHRGLEDFGRRAGATGRTLARLFRRETGMTFDKWRRQLRLLEAIRQMGEGRAVTEVAYQLGYQSPSAFTAMFRRALGASPSKYVGGRGDGSRGSTLQ